MSKVEISHRISVDNTPSTTVIDMAFSSICNRTIDQHPAGYEVIEGLSLKGLGELIKSGLAYAPVEYYRGYRRYVEGKTRYLNTIVIDIDNDMQGGKELLTVENAKHLLIGYKYLLVSSKSSGIKSDKNPSALERYRIILPLDREIGIVESKVYTQTVKEVVKSIGLNKYYDEGASAGKSPKFEPSINNDKFFMYCEDSDNRITINIGKFINIALKTIEESSRFNIESSSGLEVKKDIQVRLKSTDEVVWVSELEEDTATGCPYPERHKNGGSAFIVESKDGKSKGVHCHGCSETFWVENKEKEFEPIAVFKYISSKVGVGKTRNAINNALLADGREMHIIVMPTVKLVEEKYIESLNRLIELNSEGANIAKGIGRCFSGNRILFNNNGMTEEIQEGDKLRDSAQRQFDMLLPLKSIKIIFITHATFINHKEKLRDFDGMKIKVIIDEEILCLEDINITKMTKARFDATIGKYLTFHDVNPEEDREAKDTLILARVEDNKRKELIEDIKYEKGTLTKEIRDIFKKILDENWKCCFIKEEIEALQRGNCIKDKYNLAMTGILDPKKFDGLDITFMVAAFETTVFYHTWTSMGVKFIDSSPSHLKSRENLDRPIKIHVAYSGDEVKDDWKPSRNHFDLISKVSRYNNLNLTIKYINEHIISSEDKVYYTVANFFVQEVSYLEKRNQGINIPKEWEWKYVSNYEGSNEYLKCNVGVYLRTFNYNSNIKQKYIKHFNLDVSTLEYGRNMTKVLQYPRGLNRSTDSNTINDCFRLVVPTMEYALKLQEYNFSDYKNVEIIHHTIEGLTFQRPKEDKTPKEDKLIGDWLLINRGCMFNFDDIKNAKLVTKDTFYIKNFNHDSYLNYAFKGREGVKKATYYRNKETLEFFRARLIGS